MGLATPMTSALGIEAPILQSGMGGVAGPELVAAVSNAGGLGVLAALRLEPDQVRAAIKKVRTLTNKPFGVNIWLHDDVRTPPNPTSISDDRLRAVQDVLNEYRPRLDLEPTLTLPDPGPDLVNAAIEVMIEEQVPVFSAAIGTPEPRLVERFHSVGTKVVSMVATVADGLDASDHGVDVVVAQGSEAGGHRSYGSKRSKSDAVGTSTFVLIPELRDAISLPLAAAGGIVDGRGLASMLVLGADGVLLGTRFVATTESMASDIWKQRLVAGERRTTLTDGFTGQWARILDSEFADRWETSQVEALPGLLQATAGKDLFSAAKAVGDDQLQPLYAGAGVSGLSSIVGAGDVINDMVAEAHEALESVQSRLDPTRDPRSGDNSPANQ